MKIKTITLTVAQALVKFLDQQYLVVDGKEYKFVKGIWGIFGHGNVVGLSEALAETKHHLEFHQGYSEQGMGHIATGFAKQNNGHMIYGVTSSVGPGAANMVTAAATATANRIPVLFLPGDVFATRQPDPVLQQIEDLSSAAITTNDAFKPVSVYWDRIDRPEKLMSALLNGFRYLTNPADYGAVTLSLPQDVQGEIYEWPVSFFGKRKYYIERTLPSEEALKRALLVLKSAKRPLLILGGGVKISDAGQTILNFAQKHQIPFSETQAGKSAILSSEKYNLGGVGVTGTEPANEYLKKADLVIGVGTRYTDFTTGSKSLFSEQQRVININVKHFDAFKLEALMLVGDAKKTICKLSNLLGDIKYDNEKLISQLQKKWALELNRLGHIKVDNINSFKPEVIDDNIAQVIEFAHDTKSQFPQTTALRVINETIDGDDVVVAAGGSTPADLQRMWQSRGLNTYHVEFGYSCMGYEIPAAVGAKLVVGQTQEVYSILGDGSYMMLHSELLTSIKDNIKISVILLNNSSFGCINNLQANSGISSLGTEFRRPNHQFMHVNYSQQAQSYGVKTYRVKNEIELHEAIVAARQIPTSTLIEVLVLPKTMTDGYSSWWNVGNAQVSNSPKVRAATLKNNLVRNTIKKY